MVLFIDLKLIKNSVKNNLLLYFITYSYYGHFTRFNQILRERGIKEL